jgi:hypothetical protein
MWDIDDSDIRKDLSDAINEVKQQMETPVKVVNKKPINSEGTQGSKKIVKEDGKVYLYHKVDNEWYKTEMEKA